MRFLPESRTLPRIGSRDPRLIPRRNCFRAALGLIAKAVLVFGFMIPVDALAQRFNVLSGGSDGGDSVYFTAASGVSNQGVVVGDGAPRNGLLWELEPKSTFIWREGSGFEVIFKPDTVGLGYVLQSVSSDGSTLVGSLGVLNFRAATVQSVGSDDIESVNDPDVDLASSESFAASYDGQWIAGSTRVAIDGNIYGRSFYDQAWLWSEAGGTVWLGYLAEAGLAIRQSEALAISADGSALVGYSNASAEGGLEAFRWSATTGMIGLGDFAGGTVNSRAYDISASGNAIVGYGESESGMEAALWLDGGGIQNLGVTEGGHRMEIANATSQDGAIIVGHGRIEEDWTAMIWTNGSGLRLLADLVESELPEIDLQGWKLRETIDISDNGRYIVGRGVDPDDDEGSWRLDLGADFWSDLYTPNASVNLSLELVERTAEADSIRINPDDTREVVLESSSNLQDWDEIDALFLYQGLARQVLVDAPASEGAIFYRLRSPD